MTPVIRNAIALVNHDVTVMLCGRLPHVSALVMNYDEDYFTNKHDTHKPCPDGFVCAIWFGLILTIDINRWSNWLICRFWRVTADHRWTPLTKASDAEHWIWNVILMKFLPLAALRIVILTTFNTANDENFFKIMTFSFQPRSAPQQMVEQTMQMPVIGYAIALIMTSL